MIRKSTGVITYKTGETGITGPTGETGPTIPPLDLMLWRFNQRNPFDNASGQATRIDGKFFGRIITNGIRFGFEISAQGQSGEVLGIWGGLGNFPDSQQAAEGAVAWVKAFARFNPRKV